MEEPASKRRKIEELAPQSEENPSLAAPEAAVIPNRSNIFTEACSICGEKQGKYRCPGCESISCSLDCTKRHRKETLCTGKRSRTEYKEIKQMTDQDFVKDLHLLHQAKESSQTAKKVARKVPGSSVRGLPKKLRVLHQEARRLKINITFLPAFMKRHKENTTFFDYKRVMILWRCEFVFQALKTGNDNVSNKLFVVPNVEDVKTFGELLSNQLRGKKVVIPDHLIPKRKRVEEGESEHSSHQNDGNSTRAVSSASVELEPDMTLANLIQGSVYEASGPDNWIFLLKHERCPSSRPLYHKSTATDNLRRTLEYRDVLEFPSLICLPSEEYLKENSESYPLYSLESYQHLQAHLKQEEAAIIARVAEKQRLIDEIEARRELHMDSMNASAVKLDMIAKEMGIAIGDGEGDEAVTKEQLLQKLARDAADLPEDAEPESSESNVSSSSDDDDESSEDDDEEKASSSSSEEDNEVSPSTQPSNAQDV